MKHVELDFITNGRITDEFIRHVESNLVENDDVYYFPLVNVGECSQEEVAVAFKAINSITPVIQVYTTLDEIGQRCFDAFGTMENLALLAVKPTNIMALDNFDVIVARFEDITCYSVFTGEIVIQEEEGKEND